MDVGVYRGRGTEFVVVHASMQPPRAAVAVHGPLRCMGVVPVMGRDWPDLWPRLAAELDARAYCVVDEAEGLALLGRNPGGPARKVTGVHS